MRHYELVPVRYNAQQLLTRCDPIDAELWSIQWRWNGEEFTIPDSIENRAHWFADCSPLEYETASALVSWLNEREAVLKS